VLALVQKRLMREVCSSTLSGSNLPDSLAATATPSEIDSECHGHSTVQQLAAYVRRFSDRADDLSDAQVTILTDSPLSRD